MEKELQSVGRARMPVCVEWEVMYNARAHLQSAAADMTNNSHTNSRPLHAQRALRGTNVSLHFLERRLLARCLQTCV